MPPLSISGRGEGAGSAASTGRRECTDTAPNVQQWLVPTQIRCALGNLARASLSVMQAGEPVASEGPTMETKARGTIKRAATAKASTVLRAKTRSPVLPVNTLRITGLHRTPSAHRVRRGAADCGEYRQAAGAVALA